MASPTVAARTETQHASSTTLTIAFTQTTGDLVVIFLGVNDTARTLSTVGDGFTDLTAASATFHILYKVLTGSEGGNVAVTVAVATKGASLAYNIQASNDSIAPEFSAVATGTDTGPDPGTVTPTGGAKDYLWLAAFRQNGEEADDDTWTNSAPATPSAFGNLIQKTSGTGGLANTNGSVAAADLASNASSMNPGVFNTDQSLAWRAYTVAVHPIIDTTVTPGVASLTLTAFAPTVTVTNNQLVTPGVASLALTTFAPTVLTPRLVTPGLATLTTARFAPTVTIDNRAVPGTASLVLTPFTATVTVGAGALVLTPDTATLALTAYAPTVSAPRLVTPGLATLALTAFAPTVAAPRLVTPGTAAVVTTRFAPTVLTPRLVTPGIAALITTRFAPTVTASDHKRATPGPVALVLAAFTPIVTATGGDTGGIPPGYGADLPDPKGRGIFPVIGQSSPNSLPTGSASTPPPPEGSARHHTPES